MTTTLLRLEADLNTSLASAVSVGATTATLSSATNADGDTLVTGKYGFTIDGGNSAKEFIVCDLVGTALTNIISIDLQGASTSGFANYHRIGATVTITDWAILQLAFITQISVVEPAVPFISTTVGLNPQLITLVPEAVTALRFSIPDALLCPF